MVDNKTIFNFLLSSKKKKNVVLLNNFDFQKAQGFIGFYEK